MAQNFLNILRVHHGTNRGEKNCQEGDVQNYDASIELNEHSVAR